MPTFSKPAFKLSATVFLFALAGVTAHSQQTVFNVPSADIMDPHKSYFEWDATLGDTAPSASITPRMVQGIGHNIEAGFNVPSLNAPDAGTLSIVPTVKWRFYENSSHTLALIAGNDVYLPIQRRTYSIGDSAYILAAKNFRSRTRIGGGTYLYSAHVIDHANRGGLMASVEETVSPRIGIATDWYSGNNSMGYVTPGASVKATSSVTIMAAYQLGNHDLMQGNHSLLFILGWNPVWTSSPR